MSVFDDFLGWLKQNATVKNPRREGEHNDNYMPDYVNDAKLGVIQRNPDGSVPKLTQGPAGTTGSLLNKEAGATLLNPDDYGDEGDYDPNTDPAKLNPLKGELGDMLGRINDAYGSLFGKIDTQAQDRRGSLDKSYAKQGQELDQTFLKSADQLRGVHSAKGSIDSSFYGNDSSDQTQTYNRGKTEIDDNKTSAYGTLGQWVSSTKGGLDASRPKVNLDDITTVQGAYDTRSSLQGLLDSLIAKSSGLGTEAGFVDVLNKTAPGANTGQSALAKQLGDLVANAAPINAKAELAKGYISRAGLESQAAKDWWLNYFLTQAQQGQQMADPNQQQVA